MTDRYKNTSDHPLDLDDGSSVASGDFATIKKVGPVTQAHLDAGTLLPSSSSRSAAGSEGGDKSGSGGK